MALWWTAASVVSAVLLHSGGAPLATTRTLPRAGRLAMGVSDRMATDGKLYGEWGKEGMRVLNKSCEVLEGGLETGLSRYELVLLVAQRAKENAYQTAEEYDGYPTGVHHGINGPKLQPAKSEVVQAIEELTDELEESGELPELIDFDAEDAMYASGRGERGSSAAALEATPPAPEPQRVTASRRERTPMADDAVVGVGTSVVSESVVPDDRMIDDTTELVEEDFDEDDDAPATAAAAAGTAMGGAAVPAGEGAMTDDEVSAALAELDGLLDGSLDAEAEVRAEVEEGGTLSADEQAYVGQMAEMVSSALRQEQEGGAPADGGGAAGGEGLLPDGDEEGELPQLSDESLAEADELFAELFGDVGQSMGGLSSTIESGGMHPGDRG